MKLVDFDFELPKNLIAIEPMKPRDHSRLLVLNKKTGSIEHRYFYNIIDYLKPGDVLIMNNSKVIPARLIGKKKNTGGKVEIFLHQENNKGWQCIVGGKVKEGLVIEFEYYKKFEVRLVKNNQDGTWQVEFNLFNQDFWEAVERVGRVPLPPYIKTENRKQKTDDKKCYQTTYASDDKKGSVAAPTAGLHFTKELFEKIRNKGVQIEYLTLHVGLGTFAPVKIDNILEHKMHSEYVEIEKEVAQRILIAKKEKRRIIAVGTTSTRTVEGVLSGEIDKSLSEIKEYKLPISTFIFPGYEFKLVDAMITNFHLPKSTLLMLVSALVGKKNIDTAYKQAIEKKYRFYSYGDAMFIE